MATILVTGFGPFPGAPINPTTALVNRLARRRPALADLRIATHAFATRYAAVDRELPALIASEKPDAIVMFGVATKTRSLRIELIARNRVSLLFPDAGGNRPSRTTISSDGPPTLAGGLSPQRLLAAVRSAGIRGAVSRNAGAYLCNYAYWRALEASGGAVGPRVAVLVHIPALRMKARPRRGGTGRFPRSRRNNMRKPSLAQFTRAAETMLIAVRAALRKRATIQSSS
jgi:pyroglutamyl-peptidase